MKRHEKREATMFHFIVTRRKTSLRMLCQDALTSLRRSINSCVNSFRLPHRKSNYWLDVKVLFVKICALATQWIHNRTGKKWFVSSFNRYIPVVSVLSLQSASGSVCLCEAYKGYIECVWPTVFYGMSSVVPNYLWFYGQTCVSTLLNLLLWNMAWPWVQVGEKTQHID